MTASEKYAKELLWKFLPLKGWADNEKSIIAKQCCTIVVDAIIDDRINNALGYPDLTLIKTELENYD